MSSLCVLVIQINRKTRDNKTNRREKIWQPTMDIPFNLTVTTVSANVGAFSLQHETHSQKYTASTISVFV